MIQVAPIDPNEFSTLNANAHQFYAQQNPTQQNPTASKGSFLTRLLPTIDSIGGGAAGAAIGTALLPGIGTLIGAGLGSAIGGGGGKVAENAAEGNKLTSGVAGEAALNGVLGAGPLRLGKFGVDAIRGGLAAKAAGTGIADALKTAGDSAANMSITKALGSKLSGSADSMAQRALKLNGSKFNTDFANRSGEEVGQFARRFNIPKLGVQGATDNVYTPGLQAYGQAVQSLGAIPKDDVLASIKQEASKYLSSAVPDKKAMGKAILDKANGVLDNLPKTINAADLNAVKSEIMGLVKPGLTDSAGLTNNDVLHAVGNGIRKTINATADKAGVTVDPALTSLGFKSTKLGDLGDELHNLSSILDQAAVKSRVGSGANPIRLSSLLGAGAGGGMMGGPAGALIGAGTTAFVNSPAGEKAITTATGKVAEKLAAKATTANPYGLKSVAKRIAPVGLADALVSNQLSNSAQQTTQTSMNPTNQSSPVNISPLNQTNDNLSSTLSAASDPFSVENIQANVQKLLQTGANDKAIQSYLSIAGTMQQLEAAAAKTPQLNATQQQQANNAVSGLSDLQTLAQEIQNDPSVLVKDAIPGGGIARRLTGTSNYEAAKQNVVDVIARLRSGAAITQDEANRYMGLLPGATDTPQIASQKLQRLYGLLSSFASPQPAQVGAADLASALGI